MSTSPPAYTPEDKGVPKALSASTQPTVTSPVMPEASTNVSTWSIWPLRNAGFPIIFPWFHPTVDLLPFSSPAVHGQYAEYTLYQAGGLESGAVAYICREWDLSQVMSLFCVMTALTVTILLLILLKYADSSFYHIVRREG
ncbi:hypothetical protein F5X97DRAFT_328254 [Nemania serpens]|nr:hypothetical protein F5X97DRAFT_328254 [Nemania serpens]